MTQSERWRPAGWPGGVLAPWAGEVPAGKEISLSRSFGLRFECPRPRRDAALQAGGTPAFLWRRAHDDFCKASELTTSAYARKRAEYCVG